MTEDRISQLREVLYQLERRLKPLEWDDSRNQINEFKKLQLRKLREEFAAAQQELKSLEQQAKSQSPAVVPAVAPPEVVESAQNPVNA